MENLQEQINIKNADILTAKSLLWDTDYHVIKSYELKVELDPDIKKQREDARDLINTRQTEIDGLQKQLDDELLNQQVPA